MPELCVHVLDWYLIEQDSPQQCFISQMPTAAKAGPGQSQEIGLQLASSRITGIPTFEPESVGMCLSRQW